MYSRGKLILDLCKKNENDINDPGNSSSQENIHEKKQTLSSIGTMSSTIKDSKPECSSSSLITMDDLEIETNTNNQVTIAEEDMEVAGPSTSHYLYCPETISYSDDSVSDPTFVPNLIDRQSDSDSDTGIIKHVSENSTMNVVLTGAENTLDEHAEFKEVNFRRRGRIPRLEPKLCHDGLVPITKKKKKDLMDLLHFIPQCFHDFYKNLPTSTNITDPFLDEDEDIDSINE